jgi:hypothetical protein
LTGFSTSTWGFALNEKIHGGLFSLPWDAFDESYFLQIISQPWYKSSPWKRCIMHWR